jgi:hypothetical protein
MSFFEPFAWAVTGLIISMAYAYLSVPPVARPARCIGWGTILGFAGGVAGYFIAIAGGSTYPLFVAILVAAASAAAAMGAFAMMRSRLQHR